MTVKSQARVERVLGALSRQAVYHWGFKLDEPGEQPEDADPVEPSLTEEVGAVPLGESTLGDAFGAISRGSPTEALTRATSDHAVHLKGAELGGLRFEKLLGEGGMGQVWKARDTALDIPVAVKILTPRLASDPTFVIRFLREARAIARLDHPNIVRVLQAGRRRHNGRYLRVTVMELVNGLDGQQVLHEAQGALDPEYAARIVLGAARALRYAHGKGVVHRDVKPGNLLIQEEDDGPVAKVLDFGLALLKRQSDGAATTQAGGVTAPGMVVGTPNYISPEQAQGKPADARTDVYSLGVTLYHLLSGDLPYQGDVFSILESHVNKPIEFPASSFAGLPDVFQRLIEGMCAKAPDDRLPLKHVIEKLEQYLGVSHVTEGASTEWERPRTNLSAMPNSFVGRETELAELSKRLGDGARLITVTGAGGIGKTRFVREYGLSVADEYPGGVWFCDLTEARSEGGVCNGVGKGLDIPLTQGKPVQQIHAALRMRGRLLVILDNFEQVSEHAAATLGLWLQDTPEVQFIVSSREPLYLEGEQSFPLGPLDSDGSDCRVAMQLFAERAADVRRGFKLDDENREAVKQIVTELDGIPLAIELAAARVSALSPQKIMQRLPRRFELLTSRRRDASARQMTLRGAIEWSWNLLQPFEQLGLAQCGVFRDGFFLESAEDVLDLSAFPDAPMTMDVIESLVEKSLLRAYELPQLPGENRYRMYESIREFADWKMTDPQAVSGHTGPDAADALRQRHAGHYVRYAELWEEQLNSHQQLEAMNRISLEIENLFAVQDGVEETNPEVAARALLAADRKLSARGPWEARIPRLARVLAALGDSDGELETRVLTALAYAQMECGTRDDMERLSKEALARADAVGTKEDRAKALAIRGHACERLGEYDAALACYAEAEAIYRELVSSHGVAASFNSRGTIHYLRGEYDAALACFVEAETILRELGNKHGLATGVGNRGNVYASRGEYDAALACYTEAEAIVRRLGAKRSLATFVGNRGVVHAERGEYDGALACYAEAEAIYRELGSKKQVSLIVGNRGIDHSKRGEYEAALACFAEAEEFFREFGDKHSLAHYVGSRGYVHAERGEYEAALACYTEAEAVNRELGAKEGLKNGLRHRGRCQLRMGRPEEAMKALTECQTIRESMKLDKPEEDYVVLGALAQSHQMLAACGDSSKGGKRDKMDTSGTDHADAAIRFARQAEELGNKLKITPTHDDKEVREAHQWVTTILADTDIAKPDR